VQLWHSLLPFVLPLLPAPVVSPATEAQPSPQEYQVTAQTCQ
jgi:hypothetical protein